MSQEIDSSNKGEQSSPIIAPEQKKRWSEKDILNAKDTREVLEAYHNARKEPYATIYDLQLTVGERLNQLGETEGGMKFTLWGEQTQIAMANLQFAENMSEIAGRLDNAANKFIEAAEKNENAGRNISQAADSLNYTAQSVSHSSSGFREAAGIVASASDVIRDAVGNLTRAASSIDDSSWRMEYASKRMNGN